MDHIQTIEKLQKLRLEAMASLHQQHVNDASTDTFTIDEYLALLVDYQWEDKQNKKIQRLLKSAGFKEKTSLQQVNYQAIRNLDKDAFKRLSTLDFIRKHENIIITGASGVGKSFLAQALGNQACMEEMKVCYSNTTRLLSRLKLAKIDGTYLAELKKLNNCKLLILDDFGLQAFDGQTREILMDIIDDRFNETSTIIAAQIPVSKWYDLFGESTIADAILDRIVNSSHRINLQGESLRKDFLKD